MKVLKAVINVYPSHRNRDKQRPERVVDKKFRDLRNNVINSGRWAYYLEPRYRFFIDVDTYEETPFCHLPVLCRKELEEACPFF